MKTLSPKTNRKQNQPLRQLGTTLVELVISISIVAILTIGMASSMLIVTRTLDDGTSSATKTSETGDVADQITADLNFALAFSEQNSKAVTFTVPDRNADTNPETIRYAWSGVVGDPLTRQYNGAAAVTWAQDVRQFNLAYLLRTVGLPPPPPEVESAEQVLIFHSDASGGSFKDSSVGKGSWPSQYFKPTLPANAVHWKITRVRFMAKDGGGANENLAIELRTADAALKPTSTVIDSIPLSEFSLPDGYGAWTQVSFAKLAGLDPTVGYCLVIKNASNAGVAAKIQYEENGSPMTTNTHWLTTSDAGSTWTTPNSTQDMRIYVYGTVTTQ